MDVQKLLTESKAGKNIQEQLEAQKNKFLAELSKQEQKLRDDEKAIGEKRSEMKQEEFSKKAKEFENELADTRRRAQERKKALEESAAAGIVKLRNEILKVVQGIADEKGYSLVINKQIVVVSGKDMDITGEALARLDKAISKIALQMPDK